MLFSGCPLQECRVNTFRSGAAAAEALWKAGGRYYMTDAQTGEWIGPSNLEDVINPAWRRQGLGELPSQVPSPVADEVKALLGAMMQAIDDAGLSEEQAFPFLSARDPGGVLPFLRSNFKRGSGGSGTVPDQEQGDQGRPPK